MERASSWAWREAQEVAGRANDACVDALGNAGKTFERGSRRNAVAWAIQEKRYYQQRARALAGIDPRVYRRASKRPAYTELRGRLKELSSEWRRFGYRRLHILLKRKGWQVNWKSRTVFTAKKG